MKHMSAKEFGIRALKTAFVPLVLYILFIFLAPNRFGTPEGMFMILQQSIMPAVIGYSMCFGYVTHIIDFTVGARVILSGLVGGIMAGFWGLPGLIIGCVLSGMAFATFSGVVFRLARIPSMIVSFGLVMILEVFGAYIAGTESRIQLGTELTVLGRAPWNFVVLAAAVVLFYVLNYRTKFSYNVRAVGSDELIAGNMGIKTMTVKMMTYIAGGILLAIGAMLNISYAGTITAQVGMNSLGIVFRPMMGLMIGVVLQSVCILPIGIFIGAFSLNIIFIGIIAMGLPEAWQNVALGLFMLVVLGISANRGKLGNIGKAISGKFGRKVPATKQT